MRAVVQRVRSAAVEICGAAVGEIGIGYLVLLGIEENDTEKDLDYICEKLLGLRVFEDEAGKMNRSILDAGGSILLVSQFTLYGDARKGRRPSFIRAARPEKVRDADCAPPGGAPRGNGRIRRGHAGFTHQRRAGDDPA